MSKKYTEATSAQELWDMLHNNPRDLGAQIDAGFAFVYNGPVQTNWGSKVSVEEPLTWRHHASAAGLPTSQRHSDSGPSFWRSGFGPLEQAEHALAHQRRVLAEARAAVDADAGLTLADYEKMFREMEGIRNCIAKDVADLAQAIKFGDNSKDTSAKHDLRKRELVSMQKELGIIETKRDRRRAIDAALAKAVDPALEKWVDALKAYEAVLEREQAILDAMPKGSPRVMTTS